MGKSKELQSTKTQSRYTNCTTYTKEEIAIYITNCPNVLVLVFYCHHNLCFIHTHTHTHTHSFLRLLKVPVHLFSRYLSKVF